ncbi:MAG: hypothetical protein ACXADY_13905 [Candidatus Hodarchaeales archaeon]|jgi:hypothetical protein
MTNPKFEDLIEIVSSVTSCRDEIKKVIHGKYKGSDYVAFRYTDLDQIKDIRIDYYGDFSTMAAWVMNIALERIPDEYPAKYRRMLYSGKNPEEVREDLRMRILIEFDSHIRNPDTKYNPFILKVIYQEPYMQVVEG